MLYEWQDRDRPRARTRERENEAQKCGMQFACKPVKATAKIKPNGKPKIETFLRLEMRVEMHVKAESGFLGK